MPERVPPVPTPATKKSALPSVSLNISGISGAEDGVIAIVYTVTIPGQTTTDAEGNPMVTPDTQEERVVHRPVKFAKE